MTRPEALFPLFAGLETHQYLRGGGDLRLGS